MSFDNISTWVTQVWWPFVQSASIASALVLVVVAAVWFAIRRRASAHLGYALFLLPLVPFVFPLQGLFPLVVPTDSALGQLLPRNAAALEQGTGSAGTSGHENWFPADDGLSSTGIGSLAVGEARALPSSDPGTREGAQHATAGSTLALAVFGIWAGVAFLLAVRWSYWLYRTKRLARGAATVRDPRLRLITRRARLASGLQAKLRVVETPGVHAPSVCGLWRPILLLPDGIAKQLDDDAITWTVHHELAHLRRLDLWVASLQRALQIMWWFHPTIWLLNRVVNELRECACDEAALARMPDLSRQQAATALVDLVEAARRPTVGRLAIQSLYSERTCLEKRIMRLMDTNRTSHVGLTRAALMLLGLTAGTGLASTQVTFSDTTAQVPVAEQEPVEVIEQVFEEEIIEEVGPNELARAAVARSIRWIAAHQETDGHWATGHGENGLAGEFNDVGVTALAIECLLESHDPSHHKAAQAGLVWLASVQDKELGLFGERKGWGYMSGHAAATRIWIRAHGSSLNGEARVTAEKAVGFIQKAQNPYGAWRFDYPPIGDNDTFVTSLMLRALAEARNAGLSIPPRSVESATAFLDEVYDEASGRFGYQHRGGPAGRLQGKTEDFPPKYSEYPTAMAVLAQLDLGVDPVDSDQIISGSSLIARLTPEWNPVKGTNDGYYWMYGTAVLQQLGGIGWKRWQRELFSALLPSQQAQGSWPLMDAWSGEHDQVHMACVYTRALQEALTE